MEPTRSWWLTLVAISAMAFASTTHGQNVPLHDPYAARIQHCLKTRQEAPHEALLLADALLATLQLPDGPRLGAFLCRAESLMMIGEGDAARAAVEQGLPLVDSPGVSAQQRFAAMMNFGGMLQSLGQTRQALQLFDQALELAGQDGSPQEQLAALQSIALTRAVGMNDNAGAEQYFQRALALLERHPMPPSMVELMLHYNYGYTLLLGQRHDEAESALARALELAPELPGQEQLYHRILSHRGEIQRAQGNATGALERFERAHAWQRDNSDAQGETVTLTRLARVHLDLDAPEQALPYAERALELAERGNYVAETRAALDTLVDVHSALEDHAQVIAFTSRALAFERESARVVDLERLAALQARADAAQAARSSSPRANALRDTAIGVLALLLVVGAVLLLRSRRRQNLLATQSAVDPLTGLYNRREGVRLIEALAPPAASGEARHALLVVDIDRFKAVNDSHGHGAGDRVLAQVASHLQEACDSGDILVRWGGEEFLVVRPHSSRKAAFAFADHLRRRIEGQAFELPGGLSLAVTISIGLAPSPFFPGKAGPWQEAIGMADRALYVAKHAGRNAWAGVWGLEEGRDVDLFSVREDPQHALAQGWIAISGNKPMSWSPAPDVPTPWSGARAVADPGKRARHVS
ncbi:diguanylate cyclase [Luteimonas sp. A478]